MLEDKVKREKKIDGRIKMRNICQEIIKVREERILNEEI